MWGIFDTGDLELRKSHANQEVGACRMCVAAILDPKTCDSAGSPRQLQLDWVSWSSRYLNCSSTDSFLTGCLRYPERLFLSAHDVASRLLWYHWYSIRTAREMHNERDVSLLIFITSGVLESSIYSGGFLLPPLMFALHSPDHLLFQPRRFRTTARALVILAFKLATQLSNLEDRKSVV